MQQAALPGARHRAVHRPPEAGDAVPRPALRVQPAGGRAGRRRSPTPTSRSNSRRSRRSTSARTGSATRPARRSTSTQIAKQGLTEAQVREDVRASVVQNKLYTKVTDDVTVDDEDIEEYYKKNKEQYVLPESRDVRHILVKKKALADDLYQQLTERRQLRGAREEVLRGPGLESIGRQDDGLEGPAGARVRQVRLRARRERALAADQDAVRLAHHRGADQDQEGDHDSSCPRSAPRSGNSSSSRRSRRR